MCIILAVCVIVSIVVFKLKDRIKSFIRWEALIASILAIVVTVNMVVMGPEYSLLNNVRLFRYVHHHGSAGR